MFPPEGFSRIPVLTPTVDSCWLWESWGSSNLWPLHGVLAIMLFPPTAPAFQQHLICPCAPPSDCLLPCPAVLKCHEMISLCFVGFPLHSVLSFMSQLTKNWGPPLSKPDCIYVCASLNFVFPFPKRVDCLFFFSSLPTL